MKAPDKIYLQVCGECALKGVDCKKCKFDDAVTTWCKNKIFDKDVEYIRTDAFIEKACEWLDKNLIEYWSQKNADPQSFIEDFKNYLKG